MVWYTVTVTHKQPLTDSCTVRNAKLNDTESGSRSNRAVWHQMTRYQALSQSTNMVLYIARQICPAICVSCHTAFRIRLHRRNRIVMPYTKNWSNFVENLIESTSHVAGQNLYFGCILLHKPSNSFVKVYLLLPKLKLCTSIIAKYKLHSISITLYSYELLFWTKYKWSIRWAINCGESTLGRSVLQTSHLTITTLVTFLWRFVFCARVIHYVK